MFESWQKAVLWADSLRSSLPQPQSTESPRSRKR
jgi:hypothetical protein